MWSLLSALNSLQVTLKYNYKPNKVLGQGKYRSFNCIIDLQIHVQSSTALPWASRPCRRPAWPASTPLCQHDRLLMPSVRLSSVVGRAFPVAASLHLVLGTICQTPLYLLSYYTLSGDILRPTFSAIISELLPDKTNFSYNLRSR